MYVIADVNSFVVTWGLPSPKKKKKKSQKSWDFACKLGQRPNMLHNNKIPN